MEFDHVQSDGGRTRPSVEDLAWHLPHLKRYARAICGNRCVADRMAQEVLMSILDNTTSLNANLDLRVILFRALQDLGGGVTFESDGNPSMRIIDRDIGNLPSDRRAAFLLDVLEDFSHQDIATILRRDPEDIPTLVSLARADVSNLMSRRVLVIEDELQVAQEISDIVTAMGHSVIGSAPTTQDAIEIAEAEEPDLILSDIQLANGGSGIKAVNAILKSYPLTPVVYITGFPERLTTGKGPKPAFLVTKPYTADHVRSAVSRAAYYA